MRYELNVIEKGTEGSIDLVRDYERGIGSLEIILGVKNWHKGKNEYIKRFKDAYERQTGKEIAPNLLMIPTILSEDYFKIENPLVFTNKDISSIKKNDFNKVVINLKKYRGLYFMKSLEINENEYIQSLTILDEDLTCLIIIEEKDDKSS